jgi:hypothetical protein
MPPKASAWRQQRVSSKLGPWEPPAQRRCERLTTLAHGLREGRLSTARRRGQDTPAFAERCGSLPSARRDDCCSSKAGASPAPTEATAFPPLQQCRDDESARNAQGERAPIAGAVALYRHDKQICV